jgi:hypothetical protein
LPTAPAATSQVLEIACDESGYEGDHLINATTDVFAHASVRLSSKAAASCVQETRSRIRSPAQEYKSGHLLREKHRSTLEWLLGPSGPIHGHARVQLIDKTFFAVGRLVDLLAGENPRVARPADSGPVRDPRARAMALTLYRDAPGAFGRQRWEALLASFNDLLRARSRFGTGTSVDSFFRMVDALARTGPSDPLDEVMDLLRRARPRIEAVRARLAADPSSVPPLDPLVPAIVGAVAHWSRDGTRLSIVHDQHTALTEERIARLTELFGEPHPMRLVDSRMDPRVQVADFLAGIARKIASEELNGRGDPELTGLLRPYVDPCSIWADERSWSRLAPAPVAGEGP